MLLTCSEPILKASYHEFKAFKEWILTIQEESEPAEPPHPLSLSLLQRFSHLFLEEIPSSLPLK